jgi:DNA invertase Pin-like site-specific DNA recombinase|tara:strand:+ start:162 stop:743 length:582 start_codon:yes stop_codon:yes gene_type:complete
MKVGVLSRISTSQQSNESGLEELRKICEKSDYEIVEEYVEVVSGSKGKDDRKEVQRMLSDCKKRKIQKLVVWELSRLSRSLPHLVNILKEMNDSGVDLYSVREGIDSSTQMGRTMFGMVGVFSEFELQVRKDRVQRGIDHYRKTHKSWGRKKTITDEQENNIHQLRNSGLSIRKICKEVGLSIGSVSKVLNTC